MFVFANTPDRRNTDSQKWRRYPPDVLPLWVADMDFPAPPAVLEAVSARLAHGVLGYGEPLPEQNGAVVEHLATEYGWQIDPEWIVWLPGLVVGLNVACRAVEGGVLTCTPIYPPFLSAPRLSGRALSRVPLTLADRRWQVDWAALEAAVLRENPGLLLLCHPHNPVGRCWSIAELRDFAGFAARHDLIVCSDEIHCDLLLDAGLRHQPFAALPGMAERTITLMAPSKTYNVPGLSCAFAIVPDARLRRRVTQVMAGIVPHVNVLGLVACAAAFREGKPWRQALLRVLARNRDRLEATVAALPRLSMTHVEATYLAWLDVRELGLKDPVAHFLEHGLGLSDGADFGTPGWVRLNFGCTEATLTEALRRLEHAVEAAQGWPGKAVCRKS
ncbi:MAG: PatB family C-S lyase [Zoogloeaceae bacterium]|jgi:cystathionine beta-lyase|nr:PatB family C-S lyase [Zoogloeaceae bacterium]